MVGSNSLGKEFIISCFGESHGMGVGVTVEGCPAGLQLSEIDIQNELDRRVPKKAEIVSTRREQDVVEVLSGIFDGYTTGAPISLMVRNKDIAPGDYDRIKDLPRPGHADYPVRIKYDGFNDYRGGGRFSGRMTVALVLAGAIAKKLLSLFGIEILAYAVEIGNIGIQKTLSLEEIRDNTYKTSVRCPDLEKVTEMEETILRVRKDGDSLGGIVECIVSNLPVGVGEPIFDSLDADIAKMLFSIPAVKGVEFGAGFMAARMKGSENNDPYVLCNGRIVTLTNNSGGVLGGLSTGMPILVRAAIKPTPSISKEQKTIDLSKMEENSIIIRGRHDPCIVPKAVPVVQSAVAIVAADHMLRGRNIPRLLPRK